MHRRGDKGSVEGPGLLPATLQGLRLFEEYFGIPYGLPKLDVVLTPRMMLGGMENWGLVFLNEGDTKSQGVLCAGIGGTAYVG